MGDWKRAKEKEDDAHPFYWYHSNNRKVVIAIERNTNPHDPKWEANFYDETVGKPKPDDVVKDGETVPLQTLGLDDNKDKLRSKVVNENYVAEIHELPDCDLCGEVASFDARLRNDTRWGYLCHNHFHSLGAGLGEGKGQKLVVE